jgi:hypothetical protein
MLRDGRVRGLAKEFGGNWLDVRRFQEHNSVDRARFSTFDDDLTGYPGIAGARKLLPSREVRPIRRQ